MRAVLIALLCATPAAAQEISGDFLFYQYCATCHGLGGTGDGPMAPVMIVQPADLTQLAARNGGVFPTGRVVARIDGSDPLVSHGSDMPVFGPYFGGTGAVLTDENGARVRTSPPIARLVGYLEKLQR